MSSEAPAPPHRISRKSWLGLTAIILAVYFARALRRPLAAMSESAKAFEQGLLTHRMPVGGFEEFSRFGHSINHMAEELFSRREQEAELRNSLEIQVASRTRELEVALGELRQAEARRRQLLGDISHELRTPLTAIRGEAEVSLRGSKTIEDHRDALQRITQASRQMVETGRSGLVAGYEGQFAKQEELAWKSDVSKLEAIGGVDFKSVDAGGKLAPSLGSPLKGKYPGAKNN